MTVARRWVGDPSGCRRSLRLESVDPATRHIQRLERGLFRVVADYLAAEILDEERPAGATVGVSARQLDSGRVERHSHGVVVAWST